MLNQRLIEYIKDVENPETNFNLAIEYLNIGQTAAALSYFLRCAERSKENLDLSYECLIHIGNCFDKQGNRLTHAYGCFKHAISILPKRPEAYYYLCRIKNWNSLYEDAYYHSSIALNICDFDNIEPLRNKSEYTGIHCLLFEKALASWHWGKVNECKSRFLDLVDNYWDQMNEYEKSITEKYLKQHYSIDVSQLKTQNKISVIGSPKVVDFFTYFDPTGKEILELRYNMMKDYVDEFVICESNKTQSGISIEYGLRNTLDNLGIPTDKIKIIDLVIPESEDLVIEEIDRLNCYESNSSNLNSLRSRVRERLQKDSLLKVMDEYDDNTVFIHSDIDEIINPKDLSWIIPIVKNSLSHVIRIPLVHLEGRADLRVYLKDVDTPKPWTGMFICTKEHLRNATPTQIRSNALNPYPIGWLNQNGENIQDLGWHFSWMGSYDRRIVKSEAFTHYDDTFSFLENKKYTNDGTKKFLKDLELKEGSISPSGEVNTILKNYPHEDLPEIIFDLPRVKEFLLPTKKSVENFTPFTFASNKKPTVWVVDNFYDDPHAVRDFALKQEYVEGGFGRGFIGSRTEKQFLWPGLKKSFEEIIGQKITKWEEHDMNGRFQYCWSGQPLVYHCDSQKFGGMLYLSPDAPYQCGTSLFAHKQTRARNYYEDGWDVAWKDIPGDPHLDGTPFEPVDVMGNVYNRLIIFDASSIHSASEYFGTVKENCRLWQMFFFDAE